MYLQPGRKNADIHSSLNYFFFSFFLSFQVLISLESNSTVPDLCLLVVAGQEQISKCIVFDLCCTSFPQSIKRSLSIWPTALSYFNEFHTNNRYCGQAL